MEEIFGEYVIYFVIICVGEKFIIVVESCCFFILVKIKIEFKQLIGEVVVNDINSVFYYDVCFIFFGYYVCFEEIKF